VDLRISKPGVVLVLLVTALAIGLFSYLVPRFGGPKVRFSEPYEVNATFSDALGLEKSGDVWVRGVAVGKVEGVDTTGDRTRVVLSISDDYKPLYRNATVRIGQKTPLGESFVDLSPGTASAGPLASGGVVRRVLPTVTTDQALRALDAPARRSITGLLGDLNSGARDPQAASQVHGSLTATAQTVHQLRAISETLRGQDRDVAALVRNGSTVVGAIGARERSLTQIVDGGSATLEAVAAQGPALEALLSRLPTMLNTTQAALAQTRPLLTEARPALADLRSASRALTPSFERVGPVARDASAVLSGLDAFNAQALPLLKRALPTVQVARPTVTSATRVLDEVQPLLGYLEPRKQSLAAFFSNMRASVSNGDAKGSWYRFNIFVEPGTALGIPGTTGRNAYTLPGDGLNNQSYRPGDFPRLQPYAP
jgi:phospholipid/cholesterol/gamma-HCH transport system substrate-binding protein